MNSLTTILGGLTGTSRSHLVTRLAPSLLALVAALSLSSSAEAAGPRVGLDAGMALPLLDLALYGPGAWAEASLELPLGDAGQHGALVSGEWTGLATAGARTDLGSFSGVFRAHLTGNEASLVRLSLDLGAGALVDAERLEFTLGSRRITAHQTRFGVPLRAGIQVEVGRATEVVLGYEHSLFLHDQPRTIAVARLGFGVRL